MNIDRELIMKHYKTSNNQVFAYKDDEEMQKFAKEPLTPITDEEAFAIANPRPTEQELAEQRIAELKQLLASTDYVTLSDYDKDKPEILADRQAWRDEIRQLEQTL
jgi:hypothetical protein